MFVEKGVVVLHDFVPFQPISYTSPLIALQPSAPQEGNRWESPVSIC
jgi:hypothetical protein